ncbi:MAG: DUF2336 domain-containing protein [Alphaproteobacteria bacterium]|nr:DUF2336 domain-containing protein [Alphaproteobacteria bacterium]
MISPSRRQGVDIRPSLLWIITDLYVQSSRHNEEEERQYTELALRLIDQVDDATRSAVRTRLEFYPTAPGPVMQKLGELLGDDTSSPLTAEEVPAPAGNSEGDVSTSGETPATMAMQPRDAAEISDIFFRAKGCERTLILQKLAQTPLRGANPIPSLRARHAIEALEKAAYGSDVETFTRELGESLILPARIAAQIVDDPGGEALAVAVRALNMPGYVFQRILLFFRKEIGKSVSVVYRLARLYDAMSERSALIMLAAWRDSILTTQRGTRHQPSLYDSERHRPRATIAPSRSAPSAAPVPLPRTGTRGVDG